MDTNGMIGFIPLLRDDGCSAQSRKDPIRFATEAQAMKEARGQRSDAPAAMPAGRGGADLPGSAWSPFRHPTFAVIWAAGVVANIGSWMYTAAAGWLMTSLDPDPLIVALVQVATTLPMFLFALPAGALADILDRRKFLIFIEVATTAISAIFAVLVGAGLATPGNLLIFTFLIGVTAALSAPAWQAIAARAQAGPCFRHRRQQRRHEHQPGRRPGARRRHDCRPWNRIAFLVQRDQQSRNHRRASLVAFAAKERPPSARRAFGQCHSLGLPLRAT
jgi:hypothetical protein